MKLHRHGAIAGLAFVGVLALSACGSDNTSTNPSDNNSSNASAIDCADGQISSSGSSAQKNAVTAWINAYSTQCSGANITYDAQGSGQGIKDFLAGKVAFAGSDSALKDDEQTEADTRCKDGKAVNLPMVASPIAVVYNVKGVDKLVLNPSVTAKIFDGKITKWNDPAIVALNSGVTLPDTTITTVYRSKDSGTTENFTKFLDAAAKADWANGSGKAWKAKAPGSQGAPDSAGIVATVTGTDGAISYVDNPDAKKNNLKAASIDFGAGPVEISDATVGKAIAAAERTGEGNNIKLSLNYALKEAGAYPLALVTYEITCEKGLPENQLKLVKSFLTYTASDAGQKTLTDAGFSQIPTEVLTDVRTAVEALS